MQRPATAIVLVLSNDLYTKWHRGKGELNLFTQDKTIQLTDNGHHPDRCALDVAEGEIGGRTLITVQWEGMGGNKKGDKT